MTTFQEPPLARPAFPEPLHNINPSLLTSPHQIQAGRTLLQAISLAAQSERQEHNYNDLDTNGSELSLEDVKHPGASSHGVVPTETSGSSEYGHALEKFESHCAQLAQCTELCSESCLGVIRVNHLVGVWPSSCFPMSVYALFSEILKPKNSQLRVLYSLSG